MNKKEWLAALWVQAILFCKKSVLTKYYFIEN